MEDECQYLDLCCNGIKNGLERRGINNNSNNNKKLFQFYIYYCGQDEDDEERFYEDGSMSFIFKRSNTTSESSAAARIFEGKISCFVRASIGPVRLLKVQRLLHCPDDLITEVELHLFNDLIYEDAKKIGNYMAATRNYSRCSKLRFGLGEFNMIPPTLTTPIDYFTNNGNNQLIKQLEFKLLSGQY